MHYKNYFKGNQKIYYKQGTKTFLKRLTIQKTIEIDNK
jgi:hypothetical protein